MNIEIIGEAYAEASVNLNKFKDLMKKEFNFDKALEVATTITYNNKPELTEEHLKILINGSLDWHSLIAEGIKDDKNPDMIVRFYVAKYSNWKKMYPGIITKNRVIEVSEENSEGYSTFLVQSLIKNPSIDINAFIKNGQFSFVTHDNKKFNWVVK